MKRILAILGSLMLLLSLLLSGCSGVRPLQKGETERCPTCGVEYPKGTKHNCNHKHSE